MFGIFEGWNIAKAALKQGVRGVLFTLVCYSQSGVAGQINVGTFNIIGARYIQLPGNAGDTILFQNVMLYSSDPGENSEGETLSFGANSWGGSVLNYFEPQSFKFTLTQSNPMLAVAIFGADGEEGATMSIVLSPQTALSDDEKADYAIRASRAGNMSGIASIASTICSAAKVGNICALLDGLSNFNSVQQQEFAKLANDPSDPNFTTIVQPVTPSFSPVTADQSLSQALADTANALFSTMVQAIGIEKALVASANRVSGAVDAGDSYWEEQQRNAVANYQAQLTPVLQIQDAQYHDLVTALQSAGVQYQVSVNDIWNFEYHLSYYGLDQSDLAMLQQLGADSTDIANITGYLMVQDPNVKAGNLLDILSAQDVAKAPEPGTIVLLASGVALLGFRRRRRIY